MGEKTGIRWTDATDNPIKVKKDGEEKFGGFYCVKISPGCTHCYAADMVATGRFGKVIPYVAGPDAPELYLDEEMLAGWAKKQKPKKRFVTSMTDIAGEFVPDEWVYRILDAQLAAPKQTFLPLTKRAHRLQSLITAWMVAPGRMKAPDNIWPGFSAENQEWFDKRWLGWRNLYSMFDFTVWVSAEPLLGPIHLPDSFLSLGKKTWVVAGGESGSKARPMHPQWAQHLRDQCVEAGVPFFFKQHGEWLHRSQIDRDRQGELAMEQVFGRSFTYFNWEDGTNSIKLGKHAAGYMLDGTEWSLWPDSKSLEEV